MLAKSNRGEWKLTQIDEIEVEKVGNRSKLTLVSQDEWRLMKNVGNLGSRSKLTRNGGD